MDRYRPESIAKNKIDKKYALLNTDLVSYPQYKRKKETKESYSTELKDVDVQNKRILLPVLGRVKIAYHRQVPGDAQLLDCTILKAKSGKYFVLLRLKLPETPKVDPQTALGMVFVPGGTIGVRSDGEAVCMRRQTPQQTKRMKQAYKTLRRRTYGSQRYEEQREYLASLYEKRANQRRDDLHKAARQITNAADALYLQKPDVRKRAAQLKAARDRARVWDESWYTLFSYVRYKAELEGKYFWGVPENFPTYHFCSACGTFNREPERKKWVCPSCGLQMNDAVNAAMNLQHMAEKYIRELKELEQKKK